MKDFVIDRRYNHIGLNVDMEVERFDQIWDWCYNNENFDCYPTGVVVYRTEQDLTEFLLRWAQ